MNEPSFIRAGTLDELRDRHQVVVSTPSGAVLVVAEGDNVIALDNRCPHMGFPLHRGGPMLYADTVGLYNVERAIRRYAARPNGDAWKLAPSIAKLAAEGRGFNG